MLPCNAVFSAVSEVISPCTAAIATCNECDCAASACAADSDCATFECRVSARVLETVARRACFSGLGGIGGGRALLGVVKFGRSTSKGEVRRSGAGAAVVDVFVVVVVVAVIEVGCDAGVGAGCSGGFDENCR